MPSQRTILLVGAVVLAILALSALPQAQAFGAGNIPSYSALEGRAFRHGDLSDALGGLAKKTGGMGILGRAKFSSLDIKRVYLANFLRDYSQANDVAGLTKLSKQSILSIVMVLSFMSFGYATGEFEVTEERLGVYRCEEHIDNPKGYADGKDAREVDPRLRGPVDPRELEIDPRTGMKNYIANESGGWATSTGMARQDIMRMIQLGREARSTGSKDTLYEAYRLLGKVMHCMEDFPAHSNWCELALHRVGHSQVFTHVGDNVKVRSPDGQMVAPLVTGTFGGPDLVHSLLGETSDHLSSASVSDLNKAMDDAKQQQSQGSVVSQLMGFLGKVPGGVGGDVSRDADELSRGPSTSPATMNPQEIYSNLFKILAFHDRVMMGVERTLEKIPGLSSLIENVSNSLATFTMTLIEPYIKPLMQDAVSGLHTTSGTLVSGEDQYEVYENPNASDPTHSQLAKDHFELILNEVAGNVALIIDRNLVNNVVAAWDDTSKNPAQVADECLEAMFHPYFARNLSAVQREMLDYISRWSQAHPQEVARLDKEHCRAHTNTRTGKASQGCGNNQSIAAPGASQQETGFGPAMAQYVGGKIGLPQTGSSNSANNARPQRNEGGDSVSVGYSNTVSAGAGTAASGSSSFFGETSSGSSAHPSHISHNDGGRHSGAYASQYGSQQAQTAHSGHRGHSQGQTVAGGYGSAGYPSSQSHTSDGQWQQSAQPSQQHGQQHQVSHGYGAPQHSFQPPPGPPPQYGGYPGAGGGVPQYGGHSGGYGSGGYGGGEGGGFGGPYGLPRPPHEDPSRGPPGGYGGSAPYGMGGPGGYGGSGGSGDYSHQQHGSGGAYGGGGYGGGY